MGRWKKNKLKVNAVPTLFSHSKPKQKREWSMKGSEVGVKKHVFSMLRNSNKVKIIEEYLQKSSSLVTGLPSELLHMYCDVIQMVIPSLDSSNFIKKMY